MLMTALMGMIGMVVVIALAIVLIHFDRRDRMKRQPER
jgi:hypothetical protein